MDNFYTLLIEPFSHGFMQRALLMAVLIGAVSSIFSCFLILKGWSLMGDAVSHAVLPGITLAFIGGIPLGIGAFAAGLSCAYLTSFISKGSRIKEDTAMAIVFSGMFAAGLVMMTKIETDVHLMHILFGNILGVSDNDLWETGIIAILCTLYMLIKRKDLMLYCFDPAHAKTVGLSTSLLNFILLSLLALTVVSALKSAGIILVIAMLIGPGAIGFMYTKKFDVMIAIAFTASISSCVLGTIASFHLDIATAPLIVVIQAGFFVLSVILNWRVHHA